MKLAEQRLGLSKVVCVKTFGEPIVDGGEKVTCRLPFSLIAQEPRQAHGRAQFPRLCLLCSRNGQVLEIRLRFRHVSLRRLERDFAGNAMSLSLAPPFLGCVNRRLALSMQRQASSNWPESAWAIANMNSCSGANIVDPADRHKSIPAMTVSTAFAALVRVRI
ncbi:hypothetical protein [Bradyrhizobium sp. AZCC 2289]|uniref:hypothetical protein n=1 Tax=Bradyrhizobium sp. AZCC 2289 TaxID=3117026 RepID=UPI002FF2A921